MAKSPQDGCGRLLTDLPVAEYEAFIELAERLDLSVNQLSRRALRAELSLYGVGTPPEPILTHALTHTKETYSRKLTDAERKAIEAFL
jgi:hypothetical protein